MTLTHNENSRLVRYPDFWTDLGDEPYEFYILGVWQEDEGYYLATDSGCSCPAYWESTEVSDLAGPLTSEQVKEEAESLAEVAYWDGAKKNVKGLLEDISNG